MKYQYILIAVVALLAMTGCQQSSDTITLGYVGPLSGPISEYGADERHAIEIAVDEINANGGVNGKNLTVRFQDVKCDGQTAATAMRQLTSTTDVEVVLGGLCSDETLAMKPIADQTETVMLSTFSTDPTITANSSYTFRASVNDEQGGRELARLVAQRHDTGAVLTENTNYARSLEEAFTQEFERQGGEVVASERYPQGADDFRSQLTKLSEAETDAIFFNPQSGKTGAQAMKQARELGFDHDFYGAYYVSGNAFRNIYGNRSPAWFINTPQLSSETSPAAGQLLDEFERRAGRAPSSTFVVGARYDTTKMIAEAIREAGYDGQAIRDYLYNATYDGVLDTYRFDEQGEARGIKYVHNKYVNGSVRVLE